MKKHATLLLSGALTLAIGAAVIVGNGMATSQALAKAINEETPARITSANYEVKPMSAVGVSLPESDGTKGVADIAAQPSENKKAQQSAAVGVTISESDGTGSVISVTSQSDEIKTVMKGLANGEVILIHMLANGNAAGATVIYPSGKVENLEGDAAAAAIERFGGYTSPQHVKGEPNDSDIVEADAVSTAVKAIVDKYALRQEILGRYNITAVFYTAYEDIDGAVWWVNLYPVNANDFVDIGSYTAILDSETGEIIRLLSATDGKG